MHARTTPWIYDIHGIPFLFVPKTLSCMERICNTRPDLFINGEHSSPVVSNAKQIMRLLFDSKESGHTIAIRSNKFGEGFYITAVDEIILHEGDTTILLKSLSGDDDPSNKIKLTEIEAVLSLVSHYSMPLSKFWTRHPTWFF